MARPPLARLRHAPTIRVVHPCGALDAHCARVAAGVAALRAAGCVVEWSEAAAARAWRGYLAGDDDARAAELVDALTDPRVDAVWVARGGSGAARIATRVVEALAGAAPKPFIGFSDATTLLNALATRLGWITFHGPVVATLGSTPSRVDLPRMLAALTGGDLDASFSASSARAQGRLLGGNLTVLASLVGTGILGSLEGPIVWLLEDVAEPPYKLDRCLTQIRQAGWLGPDDAVWFGPLGTADDAAVRAALAPDLGRRPTVSGAPAGHEGPMALLPIGAEVTVDGARGLLRVEGPWIIGCDV